MKVFNALVPELTCSDLRQSLVFYCGALEFRVAYERPLDEFAFLEREAAQIMLEQQNDHWEVGDLEKPYGRGVNFEIGARDVAAFAERLMGKGLDLFRPLEVRRYRVGEGAVSQKQFLVQDPDGYLLRFSEELS